LNRKFTLQVRVLCTLFIFICFPGSVYSQDDSQNSADWQIWSGFTYRHNWIKAPDLSAEYQVRINENFTNLKSHFFELLAHIQPSNKVELAGGYRYTIRPDHVEHRLAVLEWWKINLIKGSSSNAPPKLILIQHSGYQHDFNVNFNDKLINSNSIRNLLFLVMPTSKFIDPFIAGGILTTWNEEFNFGIDKIRFIVGAEITNSNTSSIFVQYMYEENHAVDPIGKSHIIWLRYRFVGGIKLWGKSSH
jgi:hypothetical protein